MDSVTIAFELMMGELDAEVEDLNACGAQKFSESDYDAARELGDRGKALQGFRNRISSLAEEWQVTFSGHFPDEPLSEDFQQATRQILSLDRSPRSSLVVRFSDGTVIFNRKASDTMAETIKKIGFEIVMGLGVRVNNENIVSRAHSAPPYNDTFLDGFYIKTHSNTQAKKRQLQQISDKLALGLDVSVIYP